MDIEAAKKNWDELGMNDPLFIILSYKDKEGGKWNVEDFFKTGETEIDEALTYVESLGKTFKKNKALDFGCGAGRLTLGLARHFDHVDGVDISDSMIKLANEYNKKPARCSYHINARDDLSLFDDNVFDFIYSRITLQHIRPEYSKKYVREFIRTLVPGGIIVFQVPKEKIAVPEKKNDWKESLKRLTPLWLLHIYRHIRYDRKAKIEMYGIPEAEIRELVKESGAKIIAVKEDNISFGWRGLLYTVTK